MFRSILLLSFATITLSVGLSEAGGLQALAQPGYAPPPATGHAAQPTEYWAQRSDEEHYSAADGVKCVFRVRYYKHNWKYKKYAAFGNFAAARVFMLQQKMNGYFAHLSIHEIHPTPAKGLGNWVP